MRIHPLFATHKLNKRGLERVQLIRESFTQLIGNMEAMQVVQGREYAIMKTKLEEACHAAVKAVSVDPNYQEAE